MMTDRFSIIVLFLFISFFLNALLAQDTAVVYLRNAGSGKPIENVHYMYRNIRGATGPYGRLSIPLPLDAQLTLSHINFGTVVIGPDELKVMVEKGSLELKQLSQRLDAVEIIGVRVDRENIEDTRLGPVEMMSHDAGTILTKIPAISGIRKGGGYGYDPVLRGFKYSQLGILIDGIQSSTVACPNRMDPPTSQISVNTISSVEVHKGPYSLRYGNNIGGVINFISSSPELEDEKGTFSRISGGYESNGSIWRTEALAGIRGNQSVYQLAGSWHRGSDYRDGDGTRVPASFTRANIGLGATISATENQEIRAKLTRNFARDADYPALPMDLRADDTWLIHLGHKLRMGTNKNQVLSTSAYASLVDHLMDNYDKLLDPRMVDAETAVTTKNFGARTEYQHTAPGHLWIMGIDFRHENADGYRTHEFMMGPNTGNTIEDNVWQNGRITQAGTFAEYSRNMQPWRFTVSGRVDLNSAEAGNPDPDFTLIYPDTHSTQLNPGITGSVNYTGRLFSYGFRAGRVQRSGNLSERFMNSFPVGLDPYELIGNPELSPEVNNQADLIITLHGLEKTRLKLDIFYAFMQGFISSTIRPDLSPKMPSAPGVRQYDNIDRASITGFELSMMQSLPLQLDARLDAAASFGFNHVDGDPLPEIPPMDLRASLSGRYFTGRLIPALYLRYVLEQNRISEAFGETSTPSFWLVDLDISYKVFGMLHISAGIRNLFDMAYYEHLNRSVRGSNLPIYNPGRNIFLGLSLTPE